MVQYGHLQLKMWSSAIFSGISAGCPNAYSSFAVWCFPVGYGHTEDRNPNGWTLASFLVRKMPSRCRFVKTFTRPASRFGLSRMGEKCRGFPLLKMKAYSSGRPYRPGEC